MDLCGLGLGQPVEGEGNGRAEKWFGGHLKMFVDVDVKLDPLDK